MKYAVFGGSSYLGTKFLDSIRYNSNNDIVVFVRNMSSMRNMTFNTGNISVVELSFETMDKYFSANKVDWLLNFAGKYERKNTKILDIVEANSVLGLRLLSYCVDYKVPNMMTINTALPDYFNLYSTTKNRVSDLARYISKQYGVNFYDICLEMFYGPGEPDDRFLPSCVKKMKNNIDIDLTDGLQTRDIIHVDDVCGALQCVIKENKQGYNRVSVGTGEAISIRQIVEYLKEITQSNSQLNFGAVTSRKNEVSTVANLEYLSNIGFKCHYTWREGLKTII